MRLNIYRHLYLFMVCLLCCGAGYGQTSGGPDAFGYTWKTNAHASGPVYKWIDLTTKTGAFNITDRFDDDTNFGPINMGFKFPYYWYTRGHIYIGSNGYINFQDAQIAATFPTIPSQCGVSDDYIAPFMSDLTFAGNGNPAQCWFYTDFKDTAIVSWINLPFFAPGTDYAGANTFQVILSVPDSSITFQYMLQSGSEVSGGRRIGMEDLNGKVGLNIPTGIVTNTTPATAKAIKIYHPGNSNYAEKDVTVNWNDNPGNKGRFIPIKALPPKLRSNILNQGLSDMSGGSVRARIYNGATLVTDNTVPAGKILKGRDTTFNLPGDLPTNTAGIYRFETTVTFSNDEIGCNNSLSQLLAVIDTSAADVDLSYSTGSGGSTWSWLGGVAGNSGLGMYIEPPFYPVSITHVIAGLGGTGSTPSEGVRIRIQDDNGKNLFGDLDGSPGDTLAEELFLPPNVIFGLNFLKLAQPIQINSGGVYVAVLQMGQTIGNRIDAVAPHSYRSYEVLNGVYSTWRNRKSSDPVIGLRVTKGDIAKTHDLQLVSVAKPKKEQHLTDSSEVVIELYNAGPNTVTGKIDVFYKADDRAEVHEVISNPNLAPGATLTYTFAAKVARPSAPRTLFNSFCSRFLMANDANLDNNQSCFTNETSGIGMFVDFPWQVFPNPVQEKVMVERKPGLRAHSFEARLFNTNGILIDLPGIAREAEGQYILDLSILAPGTYWLELLESGQKMFYPLIKE